MDAPGITLRAAAYERVSSAASGTRARSIEEQSRDNREVIAANGWTIAGRYEDPDRPASRFTRRNREEWERLLADLERGTFDILVLWESSRGGRALTGWSAMLDACRRKGARIYITTHKRLYDPAESRDWRSLAEDGIDSAYESEKISVRVRRALAANYRDGKPHGRCPYGYERIYDDRTRALIAQRPAYPAAAVVREIFSRVADGEPVRGISADLASRQVPTPCGGRWDDAIIRRIAASSAYAGRRTSSTLAIAGDGQPEATWPAIVDSATWRAARRVLESSRRGERPGGQRWMLSYVAACAACGAFLSVALRGSQSRRPVYRCPAGHTAIRADWLDAFIEGAITGRLSDPENYARITGDGGEAADTAMAEADTLRARLDDARGAYADGRLPLAAYADIESRLGPLITAAAEAASRVPLPGALRDLDPRTDIREQIRSVQPSARKAITRMLFSEIKVHPVPSPGRQFSFDPRRVTYEWRKPG